MSNYAEQLQALAAEADEAKRIELASAIDKDADELNEKWGNRDAFASIEKERDQYKASAESAAKERDDWKLKYADRFFGSSEDDGNEHSPEPDKPATLGIAGLWQE